jgi:trehalose 6-phosphate synthase/phosphatase
MHQSVSVRQLVALYCAADVMLVTPLRDGMNLVAKEFVASRVDDDGVLVLSEFAGAATELDGAIVVNPYDVDAVATSLGRALSLPPDERHARMKGLRRRVSEHDVHRWAEDYLAALGDGRPTHTGPPAAPQIDDTLIGALMLARRTPQRRLLLDYDGTLVPLARSPELAVPDEELLTLLATLAASPGVHIDIVSGRPREVLEQWFGGLRVGLWAEHGFWSRAMPEEPWQPAAIIPHNWTQRIYPILEQFTRNTAGSAIEIKSASLAWHYRRAHREFGARQAHELRMLLGDALSNQPWEVLEGKKVIEIRLRGVSKAAVVHRVFADAVHGAAVIAIGDDRTDEDLFRALPAGSLTVAVGTRPSHARFRVEDHRAVRSLLRSLMTAPGSGAAGSGDGDRRFEACGRDAGAVGM